MRRGELHLLPPEATRRGRILLWAAMVVGLLCAGVAFTYKIAEFIFTLSSNEVQGFADVPVTVYFVVAAGWLFLLVWCFLSGKFRDLSAISGLGQISLPYTGWGTAWFDFDNDGWLDLLTVNGTIVAGEGHAKQPFPYDQRKVLFRNLGNGRFEDVTSKAGASFELSEAGRGAAFGDIDNDGDADVLVGNDNGRVRLLVNNVGNRGNQGNRNHWLGLRLVGKHRRDMLGARVAVIRADGSKLWRRARADGSYGSANDPRVLVGLGASADRPTVEVHWPDGGVEQWNDVAVDRWMTLKQGSGR